MYLISHFWQEFQLVHILCENNTVHTEIYIKKIIRLIEQGCI